MVWTEGSDWPDGEPAARRGGEGQLWRQDPLTGQPVVLVPGRQSRPNLPTEECPFCTGGLEAPEAYQVRCFPNRWAALPEQRCELVLFSPDHAACLGGLDEPQLRRVIELWAQRTERLGARPDVAYVLIFENRGPDIGATITHPHGQIYAFSELPPAALVELNREPCAICQEFQGVGPWGESHRARVVCESGGWSAWTSWAPAWPFELLISPDQHVGDLLSGRAAAAGLARVLSCSLSALDRAFETAVPYMLWCHQRPTDGGRWLQAHVHFHVAPAWRAPGVMRYVAAGELGSGVMFNPVDPEQAAEALRASMARGAH